LNLEHFKIKEEMETDLTQLFHFLYNVSTSSTSLTDLKSREIINKEGNIDNWVRDNKSIPKNKKLYYCEEREKISFSETNFCTNCAKEHAIPSSNYIELTNFVSTLELILNSFDDETYQKFVDNVNNAKIKSMSQFLDTEHKIKGLFSCLFC